MDILSLPNTVQAERAVIGAILLNNSAMDELVESLDISDFFIAAHRLILRAMLDLWNAHQPIDGVTLHETLKTSGTLEKIGGMAALAALTDCVPRSDTIEPYAKIIKRKARVRAMMRACNQIIAQAIEDEDNPDLLDEAQRIFYRAIQDGTRSGWAHIGDVARQYEERLKSVKARGGGMIGLKTGFLDLDKITLGLQAEEMTVLAARPSCGKTTLAFNIAMNIARDGGVVGFFSLEMGKERIAEKGMSREGRVDSTRIRGSFMEREEWARIGDSVYKLGGYDLFICDQARISAVEIRSKAQRLKREQNHLDLLVIDYLGLMHGNGEHGLYEKVTANSAEVKAIARELQVPVLCLHQLNREVEKRGKNAKPILSDLRESGGIEQDADLVMFISRNDEPGNEHKVTIDIAKQRNGPVGSLELVYLKEFNRFEDCYRGDLDTLKSSQEDDDREELY